MTSPLTFSVLAGGCSALANLSMRKNSSYHSTSSGFLLVNFMISLLIVMAINPKIWSIPFSFKMTVIGFCAGLAIALLMLIVAQALNKGPAGLTFAFFNAGSIFPNVILFLLFGKEFGFSITPLQVVGMALVIGGLFLATNMKSETHHHISIPWLGYALGCFVLQASILAVFQWRCLSFSSDITHLLIPQGLTERDDIWFMPGVFAGASLLQAIIFLKEMRLFSKTEASFGLLSGIANSIATTLLLWATKWPASSSETALIFPFFTVILFLSCNIWAYKLYHERFHIMANLLCCVGIMIGYIA